MARLTYLAFSLLLLSSCATNLSPKDRQRIQSVRIAPVTELPKAYWKPSFTSPKESLPVILTGGLAGVAGPAVYGAMANAISGQKLPPKDTAAAIKDQIPNLPDVLGRELEKSLSKTSYFGPRLKSDAVGATYYVKSVIYQYTLYKKNDGSYSPGVGADAWIMDPSGKKLAHQSYLVLPVARNPLPTATLTDYLQKPGLLKAHFEEVTRILADNLAQSLETAATK